VSLADVVDALGSDRPYRDAWEADRISAEVKRQSGRQFDPQVVEAYLRALAKKQADSAQSGASSATAGAH